ncbi:MAG TPA: adenylate/guanylate cyclase domain-containing protein [Casimicrobiaceae bacterium]|nr:adenylate/guanylate cyclase domain-containing protein [Casimicrobiaceae bacterium]
MPQDARWRDDPVAWLAREARDMPHLAAIIDGLTQRLRHAGVPLARLSIHLGTVHPQLLGYGCLWNHADAVCDEFEVRRAALDNASFLKSPLRPVIQEGKTVRRDPRLPEAQAEFPLMAELAVSGITDYVAQPLGDLAEVHTAVTYATDSPQRFSERDLALIESTLPTLLLNLDARIMRGIAANVLDAYVGPRAGARVLKGETRRGQGERIDAVIWVSDLREYTRLSDRLPEDDVIRLLNAYFDRIVNAILMHGGEVLKFIGDGLLAVFPIGPASPRVAADSAIAAARTALTALREINEADDETRAIPGDWRPLTMGIALHRGEVFFGNIGAPTRVDFTVVGPAVNLAARVEPLTKKLKRPLLLTHAVAELTTQSLAELGAFRLRGLSEPVTIYSLE